jgi:predicted DNA-binding transcriptional regulator YafY
MRADRLMAILLHLQAHGRTTAAELAERLEVSERTIYRDLDALSLAGVPVYAERGPGGGCALPDDYRTNLTTLNEAEVRTIFMSGLRGPLQELGLDQALDDALSKLQAALPANHRQDALISRQRIYFDAASWNCPNETVSCIRELQEAVWQQRRVWLLHHKGDGKPNERLVEPYGLVAKASIWYLVAGTLRTDDRQGFKTGVYRASRISSVRFTEEFFERPPDFDLGAYWDKWCADYKASWYNYPVAIRFSESAIGALQHAFGEAIFEAIRKAPPPENGVYTVKLIFESHDDARNSIVRVGTLVEVLEPFELRESIYNLAQSLAAFYNHNK